MRKLLALPILLLIALGGAYVVWPGQTTARWNAFLSLAESQIEAEFSTLEQIRSGKVKIGANPGMAERPAPKVIEIKTRTASEPALKVKPQQKPPGRNAATPSDMAKAPSSAPPAAAALPAPAPSGALAPSPSVPEAGAPEAALGAILKHEVRENQVKEETFWTQERIQQALKHGPPKSGSAPCIAFCGEKDTTVEINMPKTPAGTP